MGQPNEQPFLTDLTMETLTRLASDAHDKHEEAVRAGDQPNQQYWAGYLLAIRHLFELEEE